MRPLRAGDLDLYLGFSRDFYASPATDHPVPESYFRRTFQELLAGSPWLRGWLLTEDSGAAAGYLLASLTWSPEFGGRVAWLEELYLRPSARGRGLGRRALLAAMAELEDLDRVLGFRLEVSPANLAVSRLYEQLGFTRVPYRPWWKEVEKK